MKKLKQLTSFLGSANSLQKLTSHAHFKIQGFFRHNMFLTKKTLKAQMRNEIQSRLETIREICEKQCEHLFLLIERTNILH